MATDTRGAVYVEFLVAFMPLFILFLAICQLALVASAKLVVGHAALAGARSAIVVLEEAPEEHGGAPRGTLWAGSSDSEAQVTRVLEGVGLSVVDLGARARAPSGPRLQQGARMAPIRGAAYMPLLALAPSRAAVRPTTDASLRGSLGSGLLGNLGFALAYVRAAAVVTVHASAGAEAFAPEPVGPNEPVTVRVTFLYHCGVPLVRTILCKSLTSLLGPRSAGGLGGLFGGEPTKLAQRLSLAEAAAALPELVASRERFAVLTAEATLPNQGAAYYRAGGAK
jgi:hypothetical protein